MSKKYTLDREEELKWDRSFKKTQKSLIEAAKLAKQQIANGEAKPMEDNSL